MVAPSITVLGSANMDLVATVDAIPGPGETVTGTGSMILPGGKGANQAIAAARAGGRVCMLGAVGDDDFGRSITRLLTESGVDTTDLAAVAEPTGTAHIFVEADGENRIVVVPGANGTLDFLSDRHRAAIVAADLVLLQLETPVCVVEDVVAAAQGGPKLVLTPAPVQALSDDLLSGVDVLVPNEHEAAKLTGLADPEDAAQVLRERGVDTVVVTLGKRGCVLIGDEVIRVDGIEADAVDTTAAGDTFVGCLAVALGEGHSHEHALRWATAAAALSVTAPGASASMPQRSAIDRAMASGRVDARTPS